MGQDWPNGDEPACGDFVERVARVAGAAFLALAVMVALFALGGCSEKCTDGDQRIEASGDVFLCIDGVWVRQDNPYRPPIKA